MASISIRNLVKRYGNLTVIPDLNLEIADHEFVVFVGPSGCGKSTLLRIIAGLEPITAGELYHRRQARQRRSGGAARYRDGVPGLCALSAYARLRQHVVCAGAARHAEGRDRRAGEARGGAAAYRALSRPQAEGTFRRPAPARGDGARHRAQSQGVPVRRAAVQSRRQAARAGAGRDQGAVAGAEDHDGLRHPRPDRGHDHGRPHRGAAERHRAAIRHAGGGLRAAGQPVRRRLHRLAGDEFLSRRAGAASSAVFSQGGACRAARTRRAAASLRSAGSGVLGIRPEHFAVAADAADGVGGRRQAGRAARLRHADPFRSRRRVRHCAGRSVAAAESRRSRQPSPAAGQDPSVR